MSEGKDDNDSRRKSLVSVVLVFEIGVLIALPVVVLGIGGRLGDKHLDTSPLLFIAAIVASLIISGILVYRKVRDVIA